MISKQAKYALRALIGLARAEPGRAVLTADLAAQQRIPKKFLEQILLLLKRSGMVQSRRGALGGYVLIKPPEDIRFLDVLRLVDGPIAPLPRLNITAYRRCLDCPDEVLRDAAGLPEGHRGDAPGAGGDHDCRRPGGQRLPTG